MLLLLFLRNDILKLLSEKNSSLLCIMIVAESVNAVKADSE